MKIPFKLKFWGVSKKIEQYQHDTWIGTATLCLQAVGPAGSAFTWLRYPSTVSAPSPGWRRAGSSLRSWFPPSRHRAGFTIKDSHRCSTCCSRSGWCCRGGARATKRCSPSSRSSAASSASSCRRASRWVPPRSCRARRKVDESLFKDLNQEVVRHAGADQLLNGLRVHAVDGMKLNLPRPLADEGYAIPRGAHYPQGLVSCLYWLESKMPVDFSLTASIWDMPTSPNPDPQACRVSGRSGSRPVKNVLDKLVY